MKELNIRLPFPPTINTYYTIARGRKILSKKGRDYKIECAELLKDYEPDDYTRVEIDLFVPDKRRRDIDNYVKAIFDVLNKTVIHDDSQITYFSVTKQDPWKGGMVNIWLR